MSDQAILPKIAITAGEPAGIGPELLVHLATTPLTARLVAITDRDLLARAAARCGKCIALLDDDAQHIQPAPQGTLHVHHVPLESLERCGQPDPRNARHVLSTLSEATTGCMTGRYAAVVTAPVQKSSINQAGISFSGHTAFFAKHAHADVVMMLTSPKLRVALVSTHIPLHAVSAAITHSALERSLRIVHHALRTHFGLTTPRIAVLGLNPHAGENGYLGNEEIDTIIPVLNTLRDDGLHLLGPLPADTAFIPAQRQHYDVVVAMYHDQALPVLKSEAFDCGVNITLGLPFIRTSVDHGTALELAGTGRANPASLIAATQLALTLIRHQTSVSV